MTEQLIVIDLDGSIDTLYSDDLHEIGTVKEVKRASNVETNCEGLWEVVCSDDPRNGKYAGQNLGVAYKRRQDALDFEVAFINEHILSKGEMNSGKA